MRPTPRDPPRETRLRRIDIARAFEATTVQAKLKGLIASFAVAAPHAVAVMADFMDAELYVGSAVHREGDPAFAAEPVARANLEGDIAAVQAEDRGTCMEKPSSAWERRQTLGQRGRRSGQPGGPSAPSCRGGADSATQWPQALRRPRPPWTSKRGVTRIGSRPTC